MTVVRTTLDLDDDLLRVAKSLARQRGESIGRVVSDYFRAALSRSAAIPQDVTRNGVPLLQRRETSRPVTPELVRELLESDE